MGIRPRVTMDFLKEEQPSSNDLWILFGARCITLPFLIPRGVPYSRTRWIWIRKKPMSNKESQQFVCPPGLSHNSQMGDVHTVLLCTFFTLFSTFWCCVRPDFPSPRDSKLRILSMKLNVIFWALVCPELVLYWATKQWFEAGKVAEWFRRDNFEITCIVLHTDYSWQIAVGRDAMACFSSWAVSSSVTRMANQLKYLHFLISDDSSTKESSTSHAWPPQKSKNGATSILRSHSLLFCKLRGLSPDAFRV